MRNALVIVIVCLSVSLLYDVYKEPIDRLLHLDQTETNETTETGNRKQKTKKQLVGIPFYCCFKYPFSCAFCISSCIVCIPICWAIGNISAVALGFISDNFFPTGVS